MAFLSPMANFAILQQSMSNFVMLVHPITTQTRDCSHFSGHEVLVATVCISLTIWSGFNSKFEVPLVSVHQLSSPTSTCCRFRFPPRRMFPNGRPEHILGPPPPDPPPGEELSPEEGDSHSDDDASQTTGSCESSDEESSDFEESDTRHHKRRSRKPSPSRHDTLDRYPSLSTDKKAPVPWIEYDIVAGWATVFRIFKVFSEQCDCAETQSSIHSTHLLFLRSPPGTSPGASRRCTPD